MWLQTIKTGLCRHVLLKCFGITLFISLFFIAYFHVLNHPASTATIIPLTFLDRLFSFQPLALPIYLSLWLYVVIPPIVIIKLDELYAFTISITLMTIAGLIIFYVWPTAIPVSEIDWAQHPNISFLKSVDAAGNACPSLHVATAFFSGAWSNYIFRRIKAPSWVRIINVLWGVGIIYSTIAIRQHVALDVIGGLVLGGIGTQLSAYRFWQKRNV